MNEDTQPWTEVTPKRRAQRPSAVTPSPTTVESRWKNSIQQLHFAPKKPQAKQRSDYTEESESDSEEWPSTIKMSESTAKKLVDMIEVKIKPNDNPSTLDLLSFKQELIVGLTKCPLRGKNQGHVYIIESIEAYRIRAKNPKAREIKRPEEPIEPTSEEQKVNKHAYSQFEIKIREFELHKEYEGQCIELIKKAFPGCIDGLKEHGHLPPETTAIQVLDFLFESARDSIASRDCHMKIYDAFGTKGIQYKPNPNGPRDFFKQYDDNRQLATELGVGIIGLEQIMLSAQQAFWRSGHDPERIRAYDDEWNAMRGRYLGPNERWRAFKEFYVKRLKNLYADTGKRKGRAYYAGAEEDYIEDVRSELNQLRATQDELAGAVESIAYYSSQGPYAPTMVNVPSVASTAQSTIDTNHTIRELQAENKRLAKALQVSQTTPQSQQEKKRPEQRRKNNPRQGGRQQMKFWCYTHGVNHTHFTAMCRFPEGDHADHITATRKDPQGGSTANNDQWMMWRDRSTGQCYECKEGE